MTVTYEVSMITFLIRITVEVMLAGMLDREVGRLCRPERKEPAEARQDSWGGSTSSSCQAAAWVLPLLLCNCGANHYDDHLVFLKVIVEAELSIVQDLKDTAVRAGVLAEAKRFQRESFLPQN